MYSHAEGIFTYATGEYQHVQGMHNIEDTENKYAHIVGGGQAWDKKNIHTLDWSGNAMFAGDVTNGSGLTMNGLKSLIDTLTTQVETLTTQLQELQS